MQQTSGESLKRALSLLCLLSGPSIRLPHAELPHCEASTLLGKPSSSAWHRVVKVQPAKVWFFSPLGLPYIEKSSSKALDIMQDAHLHMKYEGAFQRKNNVVTWVLVHVSISKLASFTLLHIKLSTSF